MRRRWMFGVSTIASTAALVFACTPGTDCDFGLCAGPPVMNGEGGGADGDADATTPPPPGCDEKAEPKDSPKCVSSDFGIFVSPNGKPGAAGTMADPVDTVTAAITRTGAIRRIYVCAGSYSEHVILKSAVSLYGGFKCDTWAYDATIKPVVGKINEPGLALDVQSVSGAFDIFDLEFGAGNGDDTTPNSVAARFVGTPNAVLRRVKLTARDGMVGKAGDSGLDGSTVKHTDFTGTISPFDPTGNAGTAGSAAASKTCRCENATATESTAGGGGGTPPTGGGQPGAPVLPPSGANDAAGGAVSASNCGLGDGTGHNGPDRAQAGGGPVPLRLGTLSAAGEWKPEPGSIGSTALPGGGGGGGSGQSAGGGSGGACGGCGGFGGKPGTGGGASIALLAIASPIHVAAELVTGKGGMGGAGGDGGSGGTGGIGGVHAAADGNGCPGGDGGKGGKGGAGSGGAGGLSVGVLTNGAPPVTDGTKFTLGSAGDGGTGKSNNSGPNGVKANSASVEVVSTQPGI